MNSLSGAKEDCEPQVGRWLVTQDGSRESYAIPLAFERAGVLRRCFVDIWCRWGRPLLRCGPAGVRALAGRYHPGVPSRKVVSFNCQSTAARLLQHFMRRRSGAHHLGGEYCRFGRWLSLRVNEELDRMELDPEQDLFFGFNTICLETLNLLQDQGVFTVVDQVDPGRVEEDIVLEESSRWPGWAKVEGRMPQGYWERLRAEWQLANLVLVNSPWSAEALVRQGVPREKIIVVPLALEMPKNSPQHSVAAEGSLKVLWLGSIILRKGIQYLVEAARRLPRIEFLLAGPVGVSSMAVRSFPSNMRVLGRVTRDQLRDLCARAHINVLPTISDGFAITQLEAMAHGLPVITTPNCGQVVSPGVDGLIVPPRDSEALAEALAYLNDNRHLIRSMSRNAYQTARRHDPAGVARRIQELTAEPWEAWLRLKAVYAGEGTRPRHGFKFAGL